MRMLLGCALAVLVVGFAAADDKKVEKIDEAKLLGKWEPKGGKGRTVEFLKDGKLAMTMAGKDKEMKMDGTYKIDGNKLVTTLKFGDQELKTTITVTKLTDTEMTGTSDMGKDDTFVKIKGK